MRRIGGNEPTHFRSSQQYPLRVSSHRGSFYSAKCVQEVHSITGNETTEYAIQDVQTLNLNSAH